MRIGVITTSYPRFAGDPAGNFVAGHVGALRALGHDVEVLAAGPVDRDDDPAVHRIASPLFHRGDAAAHHRGDHDPAVHAVASRSFDRGDARAFDRDSDDVTVHGSASQLDHGDAAAHHRGDHDPSVHRIASRLFHRGDAAAHHRGDHDPSVHRIASRLFYRGGAPDLIERAPIRAAAAAAMFSARLTAAVAARRGRWDAVIAHWLVPSAIAALACDAPIVAIAHGGDVFTLRRFHLLGPVLGALHRRDARLAFVSAQLRAVARDAVPSLARWIDAAIVQPMGVDLARFAALARAPVDPPVVLVAARLVPIKGVDVAIAAMQHLRGRARLVIAGDGPERTRLATAAAIAHTTASQRHAATTTASVSHPTGAAHGSHRHDATTTASASHPTGAATGTTASVVQPTGAASEAPIGHPGGASERWGGGSVEMLGEVATDRRDELLRSAAVVVVPSRIAPGGRTEGTPAIAIEALAAGVPVIASAVGGLRELPGVRLVPPDDPRALAGAIDELIAAPPAAEALRAGVANLDWREIAPRLLRE